MKKPSFWIAGCGVLFFCVLSASCISVFPTQKTKKADAISLAPPSSPYSSISNKLSDKAWISATTGNTISYLSECDSANEASLKQLQNDSLSALNNAETLSNEEIIYNGRAALSSVARGDLDGIPVQLKLIVFKKNNCNYTLTYGGLSKHFASELGVFNKFTESFQAP